MKKNSDEVNLNNNTTLPDKKGTFLLHGHLFEQIEEEAYWNRMKHSDVVNLALEAFFKGKPRRPIPPETKELLQRRKRKKKNE